MGRNLERFRDSFGTLQEKCLDITHRTASHVSAFLSWNTEGEAVNVWGMWRAANARPFGWRNGCDESSMSVESATLSLCPETRERYVEDPGVVLAHQRCTRHRHLEKPCPGLGAAEAAVVVG